MKKIFFPLFAFLALAACTSNDTPVVDEAEGEVVKVSISLPATRTEAGAAEYVTATENECTVSTLEAYMFSSDGNLEKVYRSLITETWMPASPTEEKTVTLAGIKDKADKTILFVANGSNVSSLQESAAPGITTLQYFKELLTDVLSAMPACPLLMVAEVKRTGEASTVETALQRVAARLDLRVWDPEQITGFTLTKAELHNASTLSSIFPSSDESFPTCSTITFAESSPTATDVTREDVFDGQTLTYTDKLYKSLFYLYAAPASQMTLRLYGYQVLGGNSADAVYDIPLSKVLPQGITNIKRNTCYTVIIKDIDISDSGSFDVTVDFEVQ